MAPLAALDPAGATGAAPLSWLDAYVQNNMGAFQHHTQEAFGIYMASERKGTGMIAGIQYWQVANGYTAMALHDLWSGSSENKDLLHENLITVMDSVGHDGTPPGEGDGGSSRGKGFVNEFNDDSMWWALAALETWRLTGEERLIAAARHVWQVVSGYVLQPGTEVGDVDMSGGVIWTSRKDESSVNAITTGLYAELGARLAPYEPHGSELRVKYLRAAQDALGWILRTRYDKKEHAIMDTIDFKTGERHDWTFTYNTGQTIAAAVALYQALKQSPEYYDNAAATATSSSRPRMRFMPRTDDTTGAPDWSTAAATQEKKPTIITPSQYLRTALDLAAPALTRTEWVDADGTLTERGAYPGRGDPPMPATRNNDAVGFKAVLLRSLVKLYRVLRDDGNSDEQQAQVAQNIKAFAQTQFVSLMVRARDFGGGEEGAAYANTTQDDGESGRDRATDPPMQFGPWWAGPWDTPTSHSQMAALDVMSALWGVTEKGPV